MMRDYRDNYGRELPAEEVIWWKIDDNHLQRVIEPPSEEVLNAERSKLEEARSKSAQENNNVLIDEFVDPIVMQFTAL